MFTDVSKYSVFKKKKIHAVLLEFVTDVFISFPYFHPRFSIDIAVGGCVTAGGYRKEIVKKFLV